MAVRGAVRRRIMMGTAALAVSLAACVPPQPPHVPAVTIAEPVAGTTVTSPMHVTGTAEVFEAVFFLEVTDGVGTVLTTQRLMVPCGTVCPGTFDTTVSFQSAPGPLTLTAYTLSAKDGSRVDETSVALVAG
jgi:Immunoglobulin-like domain of bacterial spore germination